MGAIYPVQGEISIASVTSQLADAFVALKQGIAIYDFAALQKMDSSALALILMCQREAERLGMQLKCINMPQNLKNLAALYGVEEYIIAG